MEYYWALKVLQVLKNELVTLLSMESVTPMWPEGSANLIESAWLTQCLPNQGFAPIQNAQTLEELWDTRLLFFI